MSSQWEKILVILSDAHTFKAESKAGASKEGEGSFFPELAVPLIKLLDAGYPVIFASPKGGETNVDPISESTMLAFLGSWWRENKSNKLIERLRLENNLASPRPFSSFSAVDLNTCAGIFIPGGRAPLTDLVSNSDLGRILWHFHLQKKPTAVICHGSYALLSTKHAPDHPEFAYKGFRVACWSDAEENIVDAAKGGTVPSKVVTSLREAGAVMITGTGEKFGSITVDRELVSGANPLAAEALGAHLVEMLQGEVH